MRAPQLVLQHLLLCALAALAQAGAPPLPVVLFHGMGDNAASEGMLALKARLERDLPGVYVKSLFVGTPADDAHNSFLGRVNEQLARVCAEQLEGDAALQGGFNGVGLSQGGQFLRVLAQRCGVRVRTLVTLGAQHGGVASMPGCGAASGGALCATVTRLLAAGAYSDVVQANVVQAQARSAPLTPLHAWAALRCCAHISVVRFASR
jgi:palmitoyl-protein thioesterase